MERIKERKFCKACSIGLLMIKTQILEESVRTNFTEVSDFQKFAVAPSGRKLLLAIFL